MLGMLILGIAFIAPRILKTVESYFKKRKWRKAIEEERIQDWQKEFNEKQRLYEIGNQFVDLAIEGGAKADTILKTELQNASQDEIRAGIFVFMLDMLSDSELPHEKRINVFQGAKGLYETIPYMNAMRSTINSVDEDVIKVIWAAKMWEVGISMFPPLDKNFHVDREKIYRIIVKNLLKGVPDGFEGMPLDEFEATIRLS